MAFYKRAEMSGFSPSDINWYVEVVMLRAAFVASAQGAVINGAALRAEGGVVRSAL